MQKKSEYPTDTQIDAADCSVCVIVGAMVGAMRTDSMELEAMSPHLVAWKLQGFFTQLSQCRHLQILDGATFFTDEVIVIRSKAARNASPFELRIYRYPWGISLRTS